MINKGDEYYNQYEGQITIGNDVWIGCNATIIRKPQDITIGDGAVIGANAIVSENVPPYAIVVGVNRILKYRFQPDIIEALIDLEWWNMPINTIKANLELISNNPTLDIIDKLKKIK